MKKINNIGGLRKYWYVFWPAVINARGIGLKLLWTKNINDNDGDDDDVVVYIKLIWLGKLFKILDIRNQTNTILI